MSFDVPAAANYGGVILDDSGRLLMRQKEKIGEGYFFRWGNDPERSPENLVISSMKADFGVDVSIFGFEGGLCFTNSGTLVNFKMHYFDGDIQAAGLRWVSFLEAENIITEGRNYFLDELGVLELAIQWSQDCKRHLVESAMGAAHKEWYEKFNFLCDDVHNLLWCPNFCGGDGVFSTYIESVINLTHSKIRSIENFREYASDLFSRIEKPSRSRAYEARLVEAIHLRLTEANDRLELGDYEGFSKECEKISEYLDLYREIYNGVSPEIRKRAIEAGGAKRKNKQDFESIMLEVLVRNAPYRSRERREMIGDKIFKEILTEFTARNVAQSLSEGELRSVLRDFLMDNKEAEKFLPS